MKETTSINIVCEKLIKITGFFLIIVGIVLNPFLIKEILSGDHSLEKTTILIILFFEGMCLSLGMLCFFKSKTIAQKKKEILLALSVCFLSFFLFLIIFEVVSRSFNINFRREEAILGGYHQRNLVIADHDIGYRLRPSFNSKEINQLDDFIVDVDINSQGFRDFERNLSQCSSFIIGLGDSFTFGDGVMLNETYLALLEKKLNNNSIDINRYTTCILKAGVYGYGLHQMIGLYEKIHDIYKPKIVMLGYIPADISRIQNGFVELNGWSVAEAWLPVLNPCQNGYIEIEKKYFHKFNHFLYCNSYSYRFFESNKITKPVFNILVPTAVPPVFHSNRKTPEEYFLDLKRITKQDNSTLIIFPFCQEDTSFSVFFNENNITYYPIACEPFWHFKYDGHWNAVGHKYVAEKIRAALKENGFVHS